MAAPPATPLATPYFFFYGTLQSPAVCSRVVSGGNTTVQVVTQQQMKPAVVHGYKRCPGTACCTTCMLRATQSHTVRGHDYPAMIRGAPTDRVAGMLCLVDDPIWQRRLDEFEGIEYARDVVTATAVQGDAQLQAYAYLWVAGEQHLDMDREWSTEQFLAEKEQLWAHGDPERLLDAS